MFLREKVDSFSNEGDKMRFDLKPPMVTCIVPKRLVGMIVEW